MTPKEFFDAVAEMRDAQKACERGANAITKKNMLQYKVDMEISKARKAEADMEERLKKEELRQQKLDL